MLIKKEPEPPPTNFGYLRVGHTHTAMVDIDDLSIQGKYYWRPKQKKKKIYAIRRFKRLGKTYEIALHRVVARSRPDEEPHHINHDTLDNRKINLENVPHDKHPHC